MGEQSIGNWYDGVLEWLKADGIRVAAIIIGAVLLYVIIRIISRRLFRAGMKVTGERISKEQEMRAETLAGVVKGLILVVIVVAAVLMVLNELDYNIGPLLAGAGIAGVALGFGAQTLVKDLIGGFFILMEGQFNVGDWVQVEGAQRSVSGTVETIKMRTTLLRDVEGVLHIVPNGEIGIASNFTRGWARAVVDVDIHYREDIDKVLKLLDEVCRRAATELPISELITEGPVVQGVQELTGRNVTVRIVATTEPFSRMDVARGLRQEVTRELEKHGIAMGRGRFPTV